MNTYIHIVSIFIFLTFGPPLENIYSKLTDNSSVVTENMLQYY